MPLRRTTDTSCVLVLCEALWRLSGVLIRSWPIRLFLISMFAVPLVSLIGLWAFAASITVPEAVSDHNYNVSGLADYQPGRRRADDPGFPPSSTRPTSGCSAAGGPRSPRCSPRGRPSAKVLPGAEATLLAGDNQLSASSKADLNALEADLRGIPGIRQSVDAGTMTPAAAFQAYSSHHRRPVPVLLRGDAGPGHLAAGDRRRRHRRGAGNWSWSAGRQRWWTAR